MERNFRRLIFILIILFFLSPLLSVSPAAADQPTEQPTDQPEGFGWTQIGPAGGRFEEIVQNPFDPEMFFANVGNNLYRSLDSGQNWEKVSTEGVDLNYVSNILLEISGSDLPLLFLTNGGKVYKTPVDQISWTKVADVDGSSWPISNLKVARNDTSRMAAVIQGNLRVSRDGGMNWKVAFPNPAYFSLNTINPDQLLAFSSGNFYRSSDFGNNWETLETPPSFLDNVKTLVFSEADQSYYVLVNYSKLFKSLDFGNTWDEVNIPQNLYEAVQIANFDPNIIFLEYPGEQTVQITLDGGLTWNSINRKRVDGDSVLVWKLPAAQGGFDLLAGTWQALLKLDIQGEELQRSAQGVHEQNIKNLIVNPNDGREIYTCVKVADNDKLNNCYFSPDSGLSWRKFGGAVYSIAVNPMQFSEIVWSENERFYYSSDYGETVEEKGTTVYNLGNIHIDPNYPGKIILTSCYSSSSIVVSLDYGMTWTLMETQQTISNFLIDPNVPDHYYSFYFNEGFVSFDGGLNWTKMNLPTYGWAERFIVRTIHGKSQLLLINRTPLSYQFWTSTDGGMVWKYRSEVDYSYIRCLRFDALDSPNGIISTLCADCESNSDPLTTKYQVNLTGKWYELPPLSLHNLNNLMRLANLPEGNRLFMSTYGDSIYYIDFKPPELIRTYLPMILKKP